MVSFAHFLDTINNTVIFRAIRKGNEWYWDTLLNLTVYKYKKFNNWDLAQDKLDYAEKCVRTAICIQGLMILVLTIAGVEMIIQYNSLAPQNDLSKPGQAIPFVLGIITLIEGAASALMPKPLSATDQNRRGSEITVGQMEGRHSIPNAVMEEGHKENSF